MYISERSYIVFCYKPAFNVVSNQMTEGVVSGWLETWDRIVVNI